jgi:hypothetical protein
MEIGGLSLSEGGKKYLSMLIVRNLPIPCMARVGVFRAMRMLRLRIFLIKKNWPR